MLGSMSDAAAAMAYERMVEPLTGSFASALLDAANLGPLAGLDVLDCACGTGAVTLCAEARGANVTACDVSPSMVDRCVARSPTTATAVANVRALPAHWTGRFDLAVSSFGVIFCGDLVAGLREMARCLKPGGVLVVSAWGNADETAGFQLIPQAATACLPPELAQKVDPLKKRSEGSSESLRAALLSAIGEGACAGLNVHGPETRSLVVDDPAAYWTRFAETSPGLRGLLNELDDPSKARLREHVLELAARYVQTDGTVAVPVSAYLGVARLASAPISSSPGRPLRCARDERNEGGQAPPAHIMIVVASATEPQPRERSGDNKPELRRSLILDRLHSAGCSIQWVRPDRGDALKRAIGNDGSYIHGRASMVITQEKLDLFERVHAHFQADPAPDAARPGARRERF